MNMMPVNEDWMLLFWYFDCDALLHYLCCLQ